MNTELNEIKETHRNILIKHLKEIEENRGIDKRNHVYSEGP